jgi:hypothetical protein
LHDGGRLAVHRDGGCADEAADVVDGESEVGLAPGDVAGGGGLEGVEDFM